MFENYWSCFMISTLYTPLDPRNCRNFARTLSTADSLVLVGHSFPAWLTIWEINCFLSSRVGWILWSALSHVLPHSQLLNSLSTLLLFWFSIHFSGCSIRKELSFIMHDLGVSVRQVEKSLRHKSLLQYCSITSHLRFTRFCSLSGENLHPIRYNKLAREQRQTYSLVWKIPQVVFYGLPSLAAMLI